MAKHLDVTADTGTKVDFCDAASPWQRGNENTNGLLRQYFPKSTDLLIHTAHDLARVETELNRRPRMVLNDRSPHHLFTALLASRTIPRCDDPWNARHRRQAEKPSIRASASHRGSLGPGTSRR
jgi:IS30 family transposase